MVKGRSHRYDIAVVGTGPSGSLLAYEMARAGWSVLLLDKKELPREKPCGGGLTQRALDLIPFDIASLIEERAYTARLRVDFQPVFSQTRSEPAVHLVMRNRLDYFLAQRAADAGAVLQDRTRFLSVSGKAGDLTLRTSTGLFHARIIVGADGVHSRVARALNLPIRYRVMPALEAELVVPSDAHSRFTGSICFDFGVIHGGYAWIFPKKGHISAGILIRRRSAKHLRSQLMGYLEKNGLLRESSICSLRVHPIPCRPNRGNRYAETRGLVVGDATGLVDPVTGEGLYYALKSAHLAAAALKKVSPHRRLPTSDYITAIKTEIEAEVLQADLLARILYRWPRLSNRMLRTFGDKIGAKHIAVYRGDLGYRQLCRYVLSPRGLVHLLRPKRRTGLRH